MHIHPNARLTLFGRERLIRQHLDEGRSLAQLAADHGISERTARKWLARFRSGGPAALADRRSVRRSQRRTLDPQQLQQAVDLSHQRCTLRRIARQLLVPITTLARAMRRLGLNRLRNWIHSAKRFCVAVTASPAIPVAAAWRHDPCRHLAAGFSAGVAASQVRAGRTSDHR